MQKSFNSPALVPLNPPCGVRRWCNADVDDRRIGRSKKRALGCRKFFVDDGGKPIQRGGEYTIIYINKYTRVNYIRYILGCSGKCDASNLTLCTRSTRRDWRRVILYQVVLLVRWYTPDLRER